MFVLQIPSIASDDILNYVKYFYRIYVLQLSWWQNSIKPSQAESHVRWFKYVSVSETDSVCVIQVQMMEMELVSETLTQLSAIDDPTQTYGILCSRQLTGDLNTRIGW
jgi:hypothetical protein